MGGLRNLEKLAEKNDFPLVENQNVIVEQKGERGWETAEHPTSAD